MKLRYIIIKVKDIERARNFYSRFLNMKPTKIERDRMAVFDLQNIKVGLYNPLADGYFLSDSDFGTNYYASFGVNNVELELKRVSEFAEIICHKKAGQHDWFEFKDSEGNIVPSSLPTPEWLMNETETSSIRDENFNRILVPVVDEETNEPILNEDGTLKTSPLFVNSHNYLLWLLKNNKVGFLQLLSTYLVELLQNEEFKSKLDKLI